MKKMDDNELFDVSDLINERFGEPGTPSRIEAEKKALAMLEEEEGIACKAGKNIKDYDEVLDAKYGAPGTPSRIAAKEKALNFYKEQQENS